MKNGRWPATSVVKHFGAAMSIIDGERSQVTSWPLRLTERPSHWRGLIWSRHSLSGMAAASVPASVAVLVGQNVISSYGIEISPGERRVHHKLAGLCRAHFPPRHLYADSSRRRLCARRLASCHPNGGEHLDSRGDPFPLPLKIHFKLDRPCVLGPAFFFVGRKSLFSRWI